MERPPDSSPTTGSQLEQAVAKRPRVWPDQRSFPIELACQCQRDTILRLVCGVFGWIELDSHALL